MFPGARKVKYSRLRIPDSSDSEDDSVGEDDGSEAGVDEDNTRTSSHVLSTTPGEESNTSTASPGTFSSRRSPPLREFLQQLTAMRIQVENHPLSSPGMSPEAIGIKSV